jgi:uncharacterized membrane protein YgcG
MKINDAAHILSEADISAINAAAGSWPFDTSLTTGNFSSRSAFEHEVSAAVTGPNVVSIGLDAGHHFVSVHFGKGVNIPHGRWDAISRAGTSSFREGRWADGIKQIGSQASASVEARATTLASAHPASPATDYTAYWVAGGIIVFAALVLWLVFRRRREVYGYVPSMPAYEDASVSPSPGYAKARGWTSGVAPVNYAPAPVAPVYTQPVVVHNGGNDLLTGVILGEMMSDHHNHTTVVEHVSAPASTYDSGSSSSSYDSGSYDSGSSSSSWDSGSSFDSGGGGFDSGGGGGDW